MAVPEQLRAEIAAVLQPIGGDDRQGEVMTAGRLLQLAREIVVRILDESKNRRALEGRRVRDIHGK